MACACKGRKKTKYEWTGLDKNGVTIKATYDTEIEAKAKVLRKGGTYRPLPAGG